MTTAPGGHIKWFLDSKRDNDGFQVSGEVGNGFRRVTRAGEMSAVILASRNVTFIVGNLHGEIGQQWKCAHAFRVARRF